MIKSISISKLEEPPLLFVFLTMLSLVFNLCFPQYSASASTEKQNFTLAKGYIEKNVGVVEIKEEIVKAQEKKNAIESQTHSELVLSNKKESSEALFSRWVTVTAYSSTVDQCDSSPFITASGTYVRDGIIATNLLAFGTKVKFPSVYGDKVFVVEDRMNARYSDRADIWFETREEAKQFGIKKLEMVVVS
ncbi:MAG: hypothetical protein PHI66_02645 [Candidatus Pacebacteria bacterium]|nr:hypothetical protein [Candidatus Paceibacterota bacterium]